jgi:hypothetical protein
MSQKNANPLLELLVNKTKRQLFQANKDARKKKKKKGSNTSKQQKNRYNTPSFHSQTTPPSFQKK